MNAIYNIEQIPGESNELLNKTYILYRSWTLYLSKVEVVPHFFLMSAVSLMLT